MIMAGSRTATNLAIQTISIHGTIMVDVSYQITSEATPRNARLGGEAINGNLVVGASVQVTFVMNVATGMSVTGQALHLSHGVVAHGQSRSHIVTETARSGCGAFGYITSTATGVSVPIPLHYCRHSPTSLICSSPSLPPAHLPILCGSHSQ